MENISLAILAHVDAGKTTTAEALLYESGAIKAPGRVDHKDAFLDTHFIERQRGITIFSKQALFDAPGFCGAQSRRVFLLDTPGHADFSSEAERVLWAADCALLVISGPEGVQAHTKTLWQLTERYRLPVLVWVNKMDMCTRTRGQIIDDLTRHLGAGFADFSGCGGRWEDDGALAEAAASLSEASIEEYLESGRLSRDTALGLIRERRLFPCFFGSALKLDGTGELLSAIGSWAPAPVRPEAFGARVFKISSDRQGSRLSWLKITGGTLKVRGTAAGSKVTQIRIYNGSSFEAVPEASAGSVAAVLGLEGSFAGQGLGSERGTKAPLLVPVLSYSIEPIDMDPAAACLKLRQLAEEDPQLMLSWDEGLRQIEARFMGAIQAEVLQQLIEDRFGFAVRIGPGRVMYKETVAGPVEGVGHFEPLRHYAEVHVLLEPLPQGSGIIIESAVNTDDLDLNWQRLILGSLTGKQHLGVLTGSPLTDVRITLVAGRAHLKHTEGGDFRQAASRAVRNALMRAQNVLLEPFYAFRAELPAELIGRLIGDLRAFQAVFGSPEDMGGTMQISGRAPVSEMADYLPEFLSYTRGRGQLSLRFAGYYPCHDTQAVIERSGYDPERDVENPADSVFCSHGSGVIVKWDHVREFMHMDSGLRIEEGADGEEPHAFLGSPKLRGGSLDIDEKELEAIMQREFGPIKRPKYTAPVYNSAAAPKASPGKKSLIIVDSYNMIFAWDELKETAESDISSARDRLVSMLSDLASVRDLEIMLVFDGYKVKENPGLAAPEGAIKVVYTKEGETADAYIERIARDIGKSYSVKAASSDGMVQLFALRLGLLRMSARELLSQVLSAREEIEEKLAAQAQSDSFSNTAAVK